MASSLVFHKIENGLIFESDFNTFSKNNTINFSSTGIAVVYGPNGAGKTSLARVFASKSGTALDCEYDGIKYTTGTDLFHVINDQNNRNIIAGEAQDFLLGSDIKREFELQKNISEKYTAIVNQTVDKLKTVFTISAASSKLIPVIKNQNLVAVIKDFANSRNRGKNISVEKFITTVESLSETGEKDIDEARWNYFTSNYGVADSLLTKVLSLTAPDFSQNAHAKEIEENTVAIDVLSQFKDMSQCIVCDNDNINADDLIAKKTMNRQEVIDSLTEQMRTFIDDILKLTESTDPFSIKQAVLTALTNGDFQIIKDLHNAINSYSPLFNARIENAIKKTDGITELKTMNDEYQELISKKPDITEEDYIYIQEIISNSMSKKIAVTRDGGKNLKILLEEKEFLGKDRGELPLSTGEQNFLSLCFEFLKAKNSAQKIIVLDDPISSFDSIYKNKIVFAMVKMLEGKPRIILTHNIDLLRLLEAQYKHSFMLFLLNNTNGENNGFIPLTDIEQSMIINLQTLLNTFRHDIFNDIVDVEMFLISMLPFMRGYATIIDNKKAVEELTELMHGYKVKKVDIAVIYRELFGNDGDSVLPKSFVVNVDDILGRTVDGINIVKAAKYPLLDKTLRHSFTYLFLRLIVEKTLVSKYHIDTNVYYQLGSIISQAFNGTDPDSIRNRVRLTSKKTLINEFNHFEGNLSIFQPAIDITEQSLGKEKTDVLTFINTIKTA